MKKEPVMKSIYPSNSSPASEAGTFQPLFVRESNSNNSGPASSYNGFSPWNRGQKRARDAFPNTRAPALPFTLSYYPTLTVINQPLKHFL